MGNLPFLSSLNLLYLPLRKSILSRSYPSVSSYPYIGFQTEKSLKAPPGYRRRPVGSIFRHKCPSQAVLRKEKRLPSELHLHPMFLHQSHSTGEPMTSRTKKLHHFPSPLPAQKEYRSSFCFLPAIHLNL